MYTLCCCLFILLVSFLGFGWLMYVFGFVVCVLFAFGILFSCLVVVVCVVIFYNLLL